MPYIISVRGLVKRYGKVPALRNATFHVPEGSIAGLLGPNGSGKTTTMKILLGLLRRDSGDVEVFGMDPWTHEAEVRRRLGVLHENPNYPVNEKVRPLLVHLARIKGCRESEVDRVLRLAGLVEYSDSRIRALSRGYLQRLGLAIAMLCEPELMLLDEPTAHLDPGARLEILRLIGTLREELGATVLISSHIIPELQEVCDYAVFIQSGVVVDHGSMEELARRHGVSASYRVDARRPRLVASRLIAEEFVEAVEVLDDHVVVRVKGGAHAQAEALLSRLAAEGLVEGYELRTASLAELYARVVAG
ncbi:ATP-binding cassette domain-containing protein [Infirmifilum sp.]|uniref:ABC transporter ATP-binding protein n=1 Tax=Infirmifilum sp. TaxID=2856575 RepID=UPI003D138CFE